MTKKQKKMLYRILAALALVLVLKLLPPLPMAAELLLYCIPYLVVGWDVLRKALLGIKNRQAFDECFLMAVALSLIHICPAAWPGLSGGAHRQAQRGDHPGAGLCVPPRALYRQKYGGLRPHRRRHPVYGAVRG